MQRHYSSDMDRGEPYEAVDPFKASVAFSLKNLFGKRTEHHREGGEDDNDLTSLPTKVQKDARKKKIPLGHALGHGVVPQAFSSGPFMRAPLTPPPPPPPNSFPVVMHPVSGESVITPFVDGLSPNIPVVIPGARHSGGPSIRSYSRSRSRARVRPSSHYSRRSQSASRGRSPVSRSPRRRSPTRRIPSTGSTHRRYERNPYRPDPSPNLHRRGRAASPFRLISPSPPLPPIVTVPIIRSPRSRSRTSSPNIVMQLPTANPSLYDPSRSTSRSRYPDRPRYSPIRSQPIIIPAMMPTTIPTTGPIIIRSASRSSYRSRESRSTRSGTPSNRRRPGSSHVVVQPPPMPTPIVAPIPHFARPTPFPNMQMNMPMPSPIRPPSLGHPPMSIRESFPSRRRSPPRSSPSYRRSPPPLRRHHRSRSSSRQHYSPIRSQPSTRKISPTHSRSASSRSRRRASDRCDRSSRSRRSASRMVARPAWRLLKPPSQPHPQAPIIIQPPTIPIPDHLNSAPPTIIPITTSPPPASLSRTSHTNFRTSSKSPSLSNVLSLAHSSSYPGSLYDKSVLVQEDDSDPENNLKQSSESFLSQTWPYVLAFIVDTIPRQIYLHLLLRLPYLYFTRVSRIFEEAEMSIPEIKQGILKTAQKQKDFLRMATAWGTYERPGINEPYQNLSKTWTTFIDSLLKEWKTLNIISVLLLTAILTILQLEGAGTDPLTRFTALISMICALMSLLFGCMYIIRFGSMRKTYKAAEWASEARRTTTGIFWNVWVMLAMPAAWLAWSMIAYIVCVMSFVWRTGTLADSNRKPFSDEVALVPRIVVSVVLSLGLIYFCLIALTLRRYGALMDRAWQRRIQDWTSELEFPQTPENWATSQIPITAHGTPTSYPDAKITTYQSNEKLYPAFESPFPKPSPPPAFDVQVAQKELKSVRGPGAKNCGIHWDNKAKVEGSVVSLSEGSEIKPSPGMGVRILCRHPGYSSSSISIPRISSRSWSIHSPEPCHVPGQLSLTASPSLVNSVRNSKPLIRVTRLAGLSDGDPFSVVPPAGDQLVKCGLDVEKWKQLNEDARNWSMPSESHALGVFHPIYACIIQWNNTYFKHSQGQIQLCEEYDAGSPSSRKFSICHFNAAGELPFDDTLYDISCLDTQKVDVLGPFGTISYHDTELKRLSLFATHLDIEDELLRMNVLESSGGESGEIRKPEHGQVVTVEESDESDSDDE